MASQYEGRYKAIRRRYFQLGGATKRVFVVAEVQGSVAKGEFGEAQEPVLGAIFASISTNHADLAGQTSVAVKCCSRSEGETYFAA
jgi:hypothetical protein